MSHTNIVENTPTGITAAKNLKHERQLRRLSLAHLSEDLAIMGVTLSAHAIGRIERRQRRMSLEEAAAIASILDVDLNAFLTVDATTQQLPKAHSSSADVIRALDTLSAHIALKENEWDRQSGKHAAGMSHAAGKIRLYISEQIDQLRRDA